MTPRTFVDSVLISVLACVLKRTNKFSHKEALLLAHIGNLANEQYSLHEYKLRASIDVIYEYVNQDLLGDKRILRHKIVSTINRLERMGILSIHKKEDGWLDIDINMANIRNVLSKNAELSKLYLEGFYDSLQHKN